MYERAWLLDRPHAPYMYLSPDAHEAYQADLDRILSLSPAWLRIGLRARGIRNWIRLTQEAYWTSKARRTGARPLVKDPFLLLSVEWFVRKSDALPIILVRHPAAFVSSIKRLGWRLDVSTLLAQPQLMSRFLFPYRDALSEDASGRLDIIDHACLVWRALNTTVRYYEEKYPDWYVLRYEDLARDPIAGFESLYDKLNIPWTDEIQGKLISHNSDRNPSEVSPERRGSTRRNSSTAMWTWLSRLSDAEIARVKQSTGDVAGYWYDDADWPS